MEKLIIKTSHGDDVYTSLDNHTYDFDGIAGRYFIKRGEHWSPWIALLENGSLLMLYSGNHRPFKADYKLIAE